LVSDPFFVTYKTDSMVFIVVPTFYVVYKVIDEQSYSLKHVIDCKTKGAAVKWIHKYGEREVNYTIKEFFKKG
jgi:hypothetical protein